MNARFTHGTAPLAGSSVSRAIATERSYGACTCDPLPVVLTHGDGCWLWDEHGRRYLDLTSAHSAVNHGHAHPRLVRTLVEQAQQLAVTSRAFHNPLLPRLLQRLCELTGLDRALPLSGGAEAVESALKAARKWGHKVKGIPADRAEVIVCKGNFHGHSIAIVGFSSEPQCRDGFGPFPTGFRQIPYGDAEALARAIGPHTAAFLVEPIQGEGGVVIPPAGYLAACARICRERNVLLICDEIQTGMARTGRFLACEHENVRPDGVILGKALGGGLLPVSAFIGTASLMQVFTPGDHGSTFGGNPLAAAVALTAIDVLFDEGLIERSATQGAYLFGLLQTLESPLIRDIRGKGLFVGVEVDRERIVARDVVDRLLARGILATDAHGAVVRLAPPLTIAREAIDWAVEEVRAVFAELGDGLKRAA